MKKDYYSLRSEYRDLVSKYNLLLENQQPSEDVGKFEQKYIDDLMQANILLRSLTAENERLQNEIETVKIDYDVLAADHDFQMKTYRRFLESHTKLLNFLATTFNILPSDNVVNIIESIDDFIKMQNEELENVRTRLNNIGLSTDKKEEKLNNIIETLHMQMSREQKLIDTELEIYNNQMNNNEQNPLKLEDYVDLFEYNLDEQIDNNRIPFFRHLSTLINDDIGNGFNDFNVLDYNTVIYYHAYNILVVKLMAMYSRNYIRRYIEYLYSRCEEALRNNQRSLNLPKLVHPQTYQINSLHYLMNRYNTKCYDPDRVSDFSSVVFDLLKPEYRPDSTKALNLFQPGISKRYNSIQIYTPETIKTLEELQKKITTLLDE